MTRFPWSANDREIGAWADRRARARRWALAPALCLALGGCGEGTTEPKGALVGRPLVEHPVPPALQGTPQGLVAAGDVEGVRALLAGPRVQRDDQGRTLLHIAAIHGRAAVAKLLLGHGDEVDARDAHGMTPLHAAAYRTQWIPPGARRGMRLYPACGIEHEAVARMLLDRGADVRALDDETYTPLHWAAKGGNLAVARLLIARGADVRAVDKYRATPLHLAACGGNHEPGLGGFTIEGDHALVAKLLLEKGAAPDASSIMGTPLAEAARCSAFDVAAVLLAAGANPSATGGDGWGGSASEVAAFQGQGDLLATFLARGASIESEDSSGRTLLFMGALGGHDVVVRMLLDRGAKVDAPDAHGETPLHAAAQSGSLATLQLLVAHGGKVQAKAEDGATLLHAAAGGCRAGEEMLEYLLAQGIDVDARTRAGLTARAIAEDSDCLIGNSPMVPSLRKRGAKR